jgi:hypothetical protein
MSANAQACADLPLHVILKILSQMNNPDIGTLLTTFKGLKLKQDLKIDLTKIETTVNEYFKQLNSEKLKTNPYSNTFYLIITFNQELYIIRCRFGISKNRDAPNYNVYFRPKINTYFSIDTIPIDNIDNITNITKLLELIKNNILFNIYQTIYNKKSTDPKVEIKFTSSLSLPDNEVLLIADSRHGKSIPENILKKIPDTSADYNSMNDNLKNFLVTEWNNNNAVQEKRDLNIRGLKIEGNKITLNSKKNANNAKLNATKLNAIKAINAIYGYAKEYCKSIIGTDKINIKNFFGNPIPMYPLKFIANNFITTGEPSTNAAAAAEERKYIHYFNKMMVTYENQLIWFANELFQYYDNETKISNRDKDFEFWLPDKDIIVFSNNTLAKKGGKKKTTKKN